MSEQLSRFLSEHFSRWGAVNLNDLKRLVVDGDSICWHLHRCCYGNASGTHAWMVGGGGEYGHFHSKTREFFAEVLFTGVQLLVLFGPGITTELQQQRLRGGVTASTKKANRESVLLCGTRFNEAVRRAQGRVGWSSGSTEPEEMMPLMAMSVFMDVLESLDIPFRRVTENEVEREVATFANKHGCPVLAANPAFFAFPLRGGYIPADKLSSVLASGLVYRIEELQKQFGLKDFKLFLLALILSERSKRSNDGGSGSCVGEAGKGTQEFCSPCDLKTALERVSTCETCKEFLTKCGDDEEMQRDFEFMTDYYHRDLDLPPDDPDLKGEIISISAHLATLPGWIFRAFQRGHFEPQLLNVSLKGTRTLHPLIEDIKRDSAWLPSRWIRQHLYGFMGIASTDGGKVTEIIRAKSSPEMVEVRVSPCNFHPPLRLADFVDKDRKARANAVLEVLKCQELAEGDMRRKFNALEEKWRLPIAATRYWYRTCDNPPVQRHLVKSLLLSFLTSSCLVQASGHRGQALDRDMKEDFLTSLHAFAQWQCVYHDATALNYVAREPFSTTSPAHLYSGRTAMHYASFARKNWNVDSAVEAGSKGWALYSELLSIVTGCDGGGGRVRGQGKSASKQKVSQLVRKADPLLKETNRYALLDNFEK